MLIRRSEGEVKIDEHSSFAVGGAISPEQDVVLGDIAVKDPEVVTDESLMS